MKYLHPFLNLVHQQSSNSLVSTLVASLVVYSCREAEVVLGAVVNRAWVSVTLSVVCKLPAPLAMLPS